MASANFDQPDSESAYSGSEDSSAAAPSGRARRVYRWILPDPSQLLGSDEIERRYGVHPLVGRVLAARGWKSSPDLDLFLRPLLSLTHEPNSLLGMDRAIERLARAVQEREPILVYGDYDVDGISATALLVGLFRFLNVPVDFFVPDRLTEGYGLHIAKLEELSRRFRLIVTVDTGITAVQEADWARRHGIDLIVTDHHLMGEEAPPALAIVNPNQAGCTYADKNLAGVGVAFKLAHGLLKGLGVDAERAKNFLRDQLDLVAVGTICDMMPLTGENRAFVRHGLKVLKGAERVGMRALKVVCGFEYDQLLATQQIGFGIGPRINAAGRTANPRMAVELLTTADEGAAFRIAEELERLNDQRRKIERKIVDEVTEQLVHQCDVENERVIVCGGAGWHLGVIGIVASRILDRYHRPTIICAIDDEVAKGSGRSIEAFDLHSALQSCEGLLIQFGGHAHAAGVRLKANKIDALREAMNALADDQLCDEDMIPKLYLDAPIDAAEVTLEGVEALRSLAPFGQHNKPPIFHMAGVRLAASPRIVGRNHLKLSVRSSGSAPLDVIGFGQADLLPGLMEHQGTLELAGSPKLNEYRGIRSPQFELKDLRLTPAVP